MCRLQSRLPDPYSGCKPHSPKHCNNPKPYSQQSRFTYNFKRNHVIISLSCHYTANALRWCYTLFRPLCFRFHSATTGEADNRSHCSSHIHPVEYNHPGFGKGNH